LAITVAPPGVTGPSPRDIYFFDVATPMVPPQLAFQNGRHPTFSPDGEFIAYQETSGKLSLVKREIATGTRTVLHAGNFPGVKPFFSWKSPRLIC
jgi:hypothetical protein